MRVFWEAGSAEKTRVLEMTEGNRTKIQFSSKLGKYLYVEP